ncbi:MAG TPA: hypothetical protein VJ249_01110 [Candidatus Bathyarchaeia archaeon]|nr:hypothetical protein [Candidatus Bathyarchaeia archaeon]
MLSFSYYLHEKAEESRHSESVAYCIAIMGSVFLTGGIIQTLVTVQRPQWFLIFPYQIGSSPLDFLGLGFTLIGVMLLLAGVILGVHYGAQRLWYTNALKDAYKFEEEKLRSRMKSQSAIPELPVQRATENPELEAAKAPEAAP